MAVEQEAIRNEEEDAKRGSKRGRFEIYRFDEKAVSTEVGQGDEIDYSARFDLTSLLADHDETEVRSAVNDMWRAMLPGMKTRALLYQPGPDGMVLVHSWFGPNLQLMRHSHPALGDCLYYVAAGELVMGSQTLKAGDGWFQPNGMPYKFKAGPDGAEVLEFRAGGGIEGAPATKIDESSLSTIRQIAQTAKDQQELWVSHPQ